MKKITSLLMLFALVLTAALVYAGNVHRDGDGVAMPDTFAPVKTRSLTHPKADKTYTPTAGTKKVRINPTGAVFAKLSSAVNNKDTVGFPLAANATAEMGVATRTGAGAAVSAIVFSGLSSATKTIYIQEQ